MASLLRDSRSRRHMLLSACAGLVAPSALWAQAPARPKPPDSADLTALMAPVKDQGSRYTCAAFASNAILEAAIKRDLGRTVVLSEEFAVYQAWRHKSPGPDESMTITDLLNIAMDVGSVPEADWPYRPELPETCVATKPGASRTLTAPPATVNTCRGPTPPDSLMAKAAQLKASEALSMVVTDSLVEDLMIRIGRSRSAVIMAAKDLPDRDEWKQSGELRLTRRVQDLHKRQALEGTPNHFVALTGYDRSKRQFFFKNSWGPSWGRDGYGWISFDDISSKLVVFDAFLTANYRGQPSQAHLG